MKIKLTRVYVSDHEKALRFYTDILGFVKKSDFSQGPYRWLTVVSAEEPEGKGAGESPPSGAGPDAA